MKIMRTDEIAKEDVRVKRGETEAQKTEKYKQLRVWQKRKREHTQQPKVAREGEEKQGNKGRRQNQWKG